jgi:hypothetical protein
VAIFGVSALILALMAHCVPYAIAQHPRTLILPAYHILAITQTTSIPDELRDSACSSDTCITTSGIEP